MPIPDEGIPRTTYVLLGSLAHWGMVNAFWAALEEHGVRPDAVVVATHARHKEAVAAALPSLEALAEGFGLSVETKVEVVPEEELDAAFDRMVRILRVAKEAGDVVLDITPARKSLASVAMRAAEVEGIPRVLYLYLKDITHGDRPYPAVPHTMYRAHDLRALRP